jgi:hypothetical protein
VVLRAVGAADGVEEGVYVFVTGYRQSELDAAVKQNGKNVTGVQAIFWVSQERPIDLAMSHSFVSAKLNALFIWYL